MSNEPTFERLEIERQGRRMKRARMSAGLSRGQTTKMTGLTKAQIVCLEDGLYPGDPRVIARLCAVYGVQIDWISRARLPFKTDQDAFAALRSGKITEDQFLCWIGIDRNCGDIARE